VAHANQHVKEEAFSAKNTCSITKIYQELLVVLPRKE